MAIEQIRVGLDNFSYVIHCSSKKAAIVDPGFGSNKIINYIINNNLILDTL